MAQANYTTDELNALKGIFSLYDPDKTGHIPVDELEVRVVLNVIKKQLVA